MTQRPKFVDHLRQDLLDGLPRRNRQRRRRRLAAAATGAVAILAGGWWAFAGVSDNDKSVNVIADEPVAPTPAPIPDDTAAPEPEPTIAGTSSTIPSADDGCRSTEAPPPNASPVGNVALPGGDVQLFSHLGASSPIVQARTADGYLEPIELDGAPPPGGIDLFDVLDLNADGTPEVLLGGFGNTARNVVILEWDGCNFIAARDSAASSEVFRLLVGAGGNSCSPIGCAVRVRCVGGELEQAILGPAESQTETPAVTIRTYRYRLTNGVLEQVAFDSSTYDDADALPPDAPTFDDADRVDCPAVPTPGDAPDTQRVTSWLGLFVDVPSTWTVDSSPVANEWRDSFVGPDGGYLRVRAFDRPDRSPFVDSIEDDLPTFEQAAQELADLFPEEFGTAPAIVATTVGGRPAFEIDPSEDSEEPDKRTFLLAGTWTSRFLELAIRAESADAILGSVTWAEGPLAPAPPIDPDGLWDGDLDIDLDTGKITAEGFNEYVEANQPTWADSPSTASSALVRYTGPEWPPEVATISIEQVDVNTWLTEFTRGPLPDDSAGAVRYELRFATAGDGRLRFARGQMTWRCARGLDTTTFHNTPCP